MTEPFQHSPINNFLDAVANSLNAYTSALFVKESKGLLRLLACWSLSDAIDHNVLLEYGKGPVGWVMREKRPLNIARFKQDSRSIGLYKKDVGIKSFMAIPLPEDTGVLMADSKTKLKFTDKHINILSSFGTCAFHLLKTMEYRAMNEMLLKLLRWDTFRGHEFQHILIELMEILQMKTCLILRRIHGKGFFKLESVIGELPKDFARQVTGKKYPLEAGVCGWIFRYSKDIVLKAFGTYPERSFLLEPNEKISPKDTVLGLFFPSSPGDIFRLDHALVFAGKGDPEFWPKELPVLLKMRLDKVVPWRSV